MNEKTAINPRPLTGEPLLRSIDYRITVVESALCCLSVVSRLVMCVYRTQHFERFSSSLFVIFYGCLLRARSSFISCRMMNSGMSVATPTSRTTKIGDLKTLVEKKFDVKPENQRLFFAGKQNSKDDTYIQSCSISHQFCNRRRGGALTHTKFKDNINKLCVHCGYSICDGKVDEGKQIIYCPTCKNDENEIVKADGKLKITKKKTLASTSKHD
ncbi:hypothetical protein AGLY_002364 [Aphis glycines]|uniref:Ubiquitin-like domain-containing protein n=1 Tax=Aphis glycines TaxID=307491 RepID=A0A6G0U3B0_APHGL|nr:hypothetical protein AGLY_002364 [Aphis glycines]